MASRDSLTFSHNHLAQSRARGGSSVIAGRCRIESMSRIVRLIFQASPGWLVRSPVAFGDADTSYASVAASPQVEMIIQLWTARSNVDSLAIMK